MTEHHPVAHETIAQGSEWNAVPRNASPVPRCGGCHSAPPRKGQRYCNICHARAQREYRERLKRDRAAFSRIIERVKEQGARE